jgi:hypothetical protein
MNRSDSMSDEQTPIPSEEAEPTAPAEQPAATGPTTESWQEVGKQFQALGKSLATAVRASWYDEENRKRLQALQTGLESMVRDVSQAVHERAVTPAAQKTRAGVERAGQEVRPRVISTLRQLNTELERIIGRMDQPPAATAPADAEAPAAEAPVEPAAPAAPAEPAAPAAPEDASKKWYQEQ